MSFIPVMASISENQQHVDRISNLPTSLISHILSYLPTEDAVRTSVLSTHWNQLWATVTRLDFENSLWSRRSSTTTTPASFVNFVYRVMLFKATSLDLFRLKCLHDYGRLTHVSHWLSAALARHVQHIDIMFRVNDVSTLQVDCLFSSTTLVVLKLGRGFLLRLPKLISPVSLKILHFEDVKFEDSESLSRLVSSCPVLEELQMQGGFNDGMNVIINISSIVLKRLNLIFMTRQSLRLTSTGEPVSYEVFLNTPSLQYLEHIDHGSSIYHMQTPNCLNEALLDLISIGDEFELLPSIAVLAGAISNVRILTLAVLLYPDLHHDSYDYELPTFPRLTVLKILGCISYLKLRMLLTAFLRSAPQLESLSFELDQTEGSWDPPINLPFCMRYNLKKVEVKKFSGLGLHLSIIRYFLEKTNCLMELILPGMKEVSGEVIKTVLMLPMASKSCKIVLTA